MGETSVNSLQVSRMKRRLGWLLLILALGTGLILSRGQEPQVRLLIESVSVAEGEEVYELTLRLENLSEHPVTYSWGRLQSAYHHDRQEASWSTITHLGPRGNRLLEPGQSERYSFYLGTDPEQLFSIQVFRYRDPTLRDHCLHWLSAHSPTIASRRWFREKMRPNNVAVTTPVSRISELPPPPTRESAPGSAESGP